MAAASGHFRYARNTPSEEFAVRSLFAALLLLPALALPPPVLADATEPTADVAGSKDLPWLKRYDGSFIVSYDQRAYDEYVVPLGPLVRTDDPNAIDANNNRISEFKDKLALEGARTRIVYLVPAGRSPLEVV